MAIARQYVSVAPSSKDKPAAKLKPALRTTTLKPPPDYPPVKRGGGRPPKPELADKPWIAAGVSRMTWYRRQKKAS